MIGFDLGVTRKCICLLARCVSQREQVVLIWVLACQVVSLGCFRALMWASTGLYAVLLMVMKVFFRGKKKFCCSIVSRAPDLNNTGNQEVNLRLAPVICKFFPRFRWTSFAFPRFLVHLLLSPEGYLGPTLIDLRPGCSFSLEACFEDPAKIEGLDTTNAWTMCA